MYEALELHRIFGALADGWYSSMRVEIYQTRTQPYARTFFARAIVRSTCNNAPTPTATPSPTLTPTPTATPTTDPCSSLEMSLLSSETLLDDTCEPCPVDGTTLTDFGIDTEGTWTPTEEGEILEAARNTGRALCLHGAATTSVEAFRAVLQGTNGSTWREIKFSRTDFSDVYCATTKFDSSDPDYSASIVCDDELAMSQFTAVHEFGHVLVGRTTISLPEGLRSRYWQYIEYPNGVGTGPLRDENESLVMGNQGYELAIGARIDWQRSRIMTDNGWGSAASWNGTTYFIYTFPTLPPPPPPTPTSLPPPDLYIPGIGPCGTGAPTNLSIGGPYDYQQNPCTFPDWEALDLELGHIVEVEEAAADMFLNWVYWKIDPLVHGFRNMLWRSTGCYPDGCSDDAIPPGAGGLSGEVRGEWMDQTMDALFNEFGW